jgi:hypothetical protein
MLPNYFSLLANHSAPASVHHTLHPPTHSGTMTLLDLVGGIWAIRVILVTRQATRTVERHSLHNSVVVLGLWQEVLSGPLSYTSSVISALGHPMMSSNMEVWYVLILGWALGRCPLRPWVEPHLWCLQSANIILQSSIGLVMVAKAFNLDG